MTISKVTNRTTCLIMPVLLLAALCTAAVGKIIYVDDDATGTNNGSSWENAYFYLQDALADANSAEKPVEIRVAQGIYLPDQGAIQTPGDREATFRLISGVTLRGGYSGFGEPDTGTRDVELYETVLSGDLHGDDVQIDELEAVDLVDFSDEPTRAENSYHVVTDSGTDDSAVLDGFTITAGNANGPEGPQGNRNKFKLGGGMYNITGSPIVVNCTFTKNSANFGAGMNNMLGKPTIVNCSFNWNSSNGMRNESSTVTLTNCTFTRNLWGGIFNQLSSLTLNNCTFNENSFGGGIGSVQTTLVLTDCTFFRNSANIAGGGMNGGTATLTNCTFIANEAKQGGGLQSGSSILTNCTFIANKARYWGGGMRSGPYDTVSHCTFSGNSAEISGGAIVIGYNSDLILTNCTLTGNSAQNGNAIASYNVFDDLFLNNLEVTNCIIWGSNNEIWNDDGSTIVISYSDIQNGQAGIYDPYDRVVWEQGNIDVDPLFADPGYWMNVNDPNIVVEPNDPNDDLWVNGDYHLKSEAGRWDPVGENWVIDDVTSPCIDAGDPLTPVMYEPHPRGYFINMGAYGGTRQASMSFETEGMMLPRVAYIFSHKSEVAGSFKSLLETYGCSTTLLRLTEVPATPLDYYDLIIVANDTQSISDWDDANSVAAIEDSSKPVIGLGEGGYTFSGELELSIGYPNGGHGIRNSIEVIDPNSSLFRTPYSIEIPEDRALRLYTATEHVGLYLWPIMPETVTVLASEVDDVGYYPLAMEYNRYLLWGFTESPQKMTEIGKKLFINVVIWTANEAWKNKI